MKQNDFVYQSRTGRVVFGAGSLQHLEREVLALGATRALLLAAPEQRPTAADIASRLGERCAGIFDRVVMHVPIEVAREAQALTRTLSADCVIALGGGSSIGLGKAIALNSGLPILAIQTTYAGSEMTPIFGLTEARVKRTGTDLKVLPRTVIYDPELTMTLPGEMSVASGMNALAHAAEGLYAQDANPVTSLMAEEAIGALARGLRGVTRDASDIEARTEALYGAWLAGTVLGTVGMALHHKLCHTLGGSFNLPHAQTHAVMLPHVLAYNAKAAPDAMARVARALGVPHAARGVYDLALENGSPVSLRDIGMREIELDRAAELATTDAYWNPRRVDPDSVRWLLQMAFEGRPPEELTSCQRLT